MKIKYTENIVKARMVNVMSNVSIDFSKNIGKMKAMHAVNNGPHVAGKEQKRGNQDSFKASGIPYARVHDASFHAAYGGNHTIDVNFIFPDFDKDVNDPESYDFACTDKYIGQIIEYGAEPFYRLGSRIEHEIKKYGTQVPKDFKKWAQICEHIIMHYTKGWANGFNYKIEYWEIWNEADLDPDDSNNKRCWQGTEAQFFEFYKTVATHLKSSFPKLKIGGPASCGDEKWMERFLESMQKSNTPIDFFSWHWYWTEPYDMSAKCTRIRELLKKYGYANSESILNEWNYVRGWVDEFVYSIEQIIGMKGAAFTSACMCAGQNNPDVDMLMYYDARPCAFNGLWSFYTMRPLKGYYPFLIFSKLYARKNQMLSSSDDTDVYVVASKDENGIGALITYYAEDDNKGAKRVTIDVSGYDMSNAKMYLTDEHNTMAENLTNKFEDGKITLRLERNSIIYIEA